MPESSFAPVRFPACALRLRYPPRRTVQHSLLLGILCASLMILTPAVYLHLTGILKSRPLQSQSLLPRIPFRRGQTLQPIGTIIFQAPSPSPPGIKGGNNIPSPQRNGLIPIIGPEIDQYLEDAGYLGYFDDNKSMPVDGDEFALVEKSQNWRHHRDTATYTFDVPLERPPELVWMKDPQYPELARRVGTEGKVLLHILVGADGRAEQVRIVSEKPAKFGFGERAYAAAVTAYFQPALNDHYPVKCWIRLPVEFRLN